MIRLFNRIILTELCNENCPHCFNANFRKKGIMDHEKLFSFMRLNHSYLTNSYAKLMGGEPTLHPHIIDVIKECTLHFLETHVFTNGSRMEFLLKEPFIVKNHFFRKINFTINGFTFNKEKFKEYREFINFIILHFVISPSNYQQITDKILDVLELGQQIHIILSPDTQIDIFNSEILEDYRKIWSDSIIKVHDEIIKKGIGFSHDHRLPICFFTQEMINKINDNCSFYDNDVKMAELTGCCCNSFIGLIGTDFSLRFCNQTNIVIGNILNDDGTPKEIPEINKMIKDYPLIKIEKIKNLSEKCRNCSCLSYCKVGCYYNSLVKNSSLCIN